MDVVLFVLIVALLALLLGVMIHPLWFLLLVALILLLVRGR